MGFLGNQVIQYRYKKKVVFKILDIFKIVRY